MTPAQLPFAEVVLYDFEFDARPGESPRPVCLVFRELRAGRTGRVWRDELFAARTPPFRTGPGVLHVAYYASAEVGCHLSLGWQPPAHVLDLYAEFRCMTNGASLPCGTGLLGAAAYFGIPAMSVKDKDGLRALALQGSWTEQEKVALLDYCQQDVELLELLLPHVIAPMSQDDVGRALLRGRFMRSVAAMERHGVPVDMDALRVLATSWEQIKRGLIDEVDREFSVYRGTSFSAARFEQWLARADIAWPRTATGALALDDDTFRDQARIHPVLEPLRQLRHALGQLRLHELEVGTDGRNRTMLSAFRARTSRNQPSNTKFIFGPAVWLRGLVRAEPGCVLAYIDYGQQEFAIAAALSGDANMRRAYESGDPYLSFAVQAGLAPPDATKASHRRERDQCKSCALAVLYGMGAESLAVRLGGSTAEARQLLELHRRTFPDYWRWSAKVIDRAMLTGRTRTAFGWTLQVGPDTRSTSLMNFPMQAHGAEVLRLACIMATELGVEVCAPVHDALLIHATAREIDDAVAVTRAAMMWAGEATLGIGIRTDVQLIRHPDRYMDDRGRVMWSTAWRLLGGEPCTVARSSCAGAPPHHLLSDDDQEGEAA